MGGCCTAFPLWEDQAPIVGHHFLAHHMTFSMAKGLLLDTCTPSVVLHMSTCRRTSMECSNHMLSNVFSSGTLMITKGGAFGILMCTRKLFLIVLFSVSPPSLTDGLICLQTASMSSLLHLLSLALPPMPPQLYCILLLTLRTLRRWI